jgi:hydroxymethylbilane synthase
VVRLGTRRSALALAQSGWVARRIEAANPGLRVELVEVTTEGDTSGAPLRSFGGVGVFVSRLREALLAGRVDIAVHSLKDLPTAPAPALLLAAVPPREDPRDVLVATGHAPLAALAERFPGGRIGTGSPRRAAQVRALGLGLEVVDLRGNVDTRIARVRGLGGADADLDGVLLARAGLLRLGRADLAAEVLDPQVMLPAPGQGALAVECRSASGNGAGRDGSDAGIVAAVRRLDDADTRACVTAERALLAALEAGCSAPLGALAEIVVAPDGGSRVWLRAVVAAEDGSAVLRRSHIGPVADAGALGVALAAELLADGADALVGPVPAGSVRGREAER